MNSNFLLQNRNLWSILRTYKKLYNRYLLKFKIIVDNSGILKNKIKKNLPISTLFLQNQIPTAAKNLKITSSG